MEILISFILAVSILAISPGPDNIFVLMQSVVHGKKYGLATIIGNDRLHCSHNFRSRRYFYNN